MQQPLTKRRLAYLDWLRGVAAIIMLQGHVLEGWLRPEDRSSEWFWLSQFLGGLPAPIFLFLVGIIFWSQPNQCGDLPTLFNFIS